jgi:hypothetical protein
MVPLHHISDDKLACLLAAVLLGAVALIIFAVPVLPGGFEAQSAWLVALLPGALLAYPLADLLGDASPLAGNIAVWSLLVGLSFLWYWLLSLLAVKLLRRCPKPWAGF